MALKRGTVKLEDYNKKWKDDYEKEEKLLKDVLKDYLIEIHHVGSTSIPNLKAKPVLDILITIKSFDEIKQIENLLEKYDYHNRGQQGVDDRFFFVKGPEDAISHHIHFTKPNSDTYFNLMLFKKYLLDNSDCLQKYCDLKQELANKYKDERSKYTKGKNEFITNVISLAKKKYYD